MRLSAFLFISIAMHATALTYPIVFLRPSGTELLPVIVLNQDNEIGEEGKGDGRARGKKGNPAGTENRALAQQSEHQNTEENKQPSATPFPIKMSLSPVDAPAGTAVASTIAVTETGGSSLAQHANGSGGEGGSGGKGNSGVGSGSGAGVGDGPGGSRFVQVSYAYSPKPEYPDRARREGREGRVLLQVLVDEQGKSKFIEVNRSSGSETLDRAAAEAIKHWRFSPAHYGDKSVESWVKIPIDFRLTDAKN